MNVWFTSDWHFGHRNILHLGEGRPFATIEEHDTVLIEQHNALVAPDDEVYVLGDVAMGPIGESLARCREMNGWKVLVCGNHDRPVMTDDSTKRARWVERYRAEGGFAAVYVDQHIGMTLRDSGIPVVLSHYPYAGDSQDQDRYGDRRPPDFGAWLLHGHVHQEWRVNGRQINVGVDQWEFAPVRSETITALIEEHRAARAS